MTNDSLRMKQGSVARRLTSVRGRMRRQLVIEGVGRLLVLASVFFFLSFLVDWKFELSRTARLVCSFLGLCAALYIALRYVVLPMVVKWDIFDIAGAIDVRRIETIEQAISPKVATLFRLNKQSDDDFSEQLSDEAASRSYYALEKIRFEERLNRSHKNKSLTAVLIGILLPVCALLVMPTALSSVWASRWLASSNEPWPRNTTIKIVGLQNGRLLVPRGEPHTIQIEVTDRRSEVPDRVRLELKAPEQRAKRLTILRNESGNLEHELDGIRTDVSLCLWAGDTRLGPIQIVPVDRPRLVDVRLQYKHPWDATEQIHDFDRGDGSISLLPKTQAELILKANVPIDSLEQEWNDQPIKFTRVDSQTFSAKWEHLRETRTKVRLVGSQAMLQSQPRSISVGLKRDRPPSITMRRQGVRRRVTPSATIPLKMVARDDFGVAEMYLDSKIEKATIPVSTESTTTVNGDRITDASEPPARSDNGNFGSDSDARNSGSEGNLHDAHVVLYGPTEPATDRLLDSDYAFNVEQLGLKPGDLIRVQSAAADACYVGSQTTQSPWLAFSVVKPQELFREIIIRQQQLRARLRKAADRAADIRDSMLTAKFPEDAAEMQRSVRMNQREVSTVQRALTDTVTEMDLNKLGGPEAIELIKGNVLKPLQNLVDEEMEKQRETLGNAAGNPAKAQTDAIDRQEKILEEMKRVLKNMAQWDSFVDVVNQLDAVIKLQSKLKDSTQQLREDEVESVFEQEDKSDADVSSGENRS